MNIKELRIGNYLQAKGAGYVIPLGKKEEYQISSGTLHEWPSIPNDMKQPIPLTEQWMEKMGLEYVDDNAQWLGIELYGTLHLNIDVNNNKAVLSDLGEPTVLHKLEYVHQLQNLYYALTGKELTYNEGN